MKRGILGLFGIFAVILIACFICSGVKTEAADSKNERGYTVVATDEDGIQYYARVDSEDADYFVAGYAGKSSKVNIPCYYGKHRVYEILASAFEGNELITEVNVGAGVAKIDKNAFKDCINLKTVTFGDYILWGIEQFPKETHKSVLTLYQDAFAGCTSLEYVEFPSGVDSMGAYSAFAGSGLKSVKIALASWDETYRLLDGASELESITYVPYENAGKNYVGGISMFSGHLSNLPKLKEINIYDASRATFQQSYYTDSDGKHMETFVNCPLLTDINLYYTVKDENGYIFSAYGNSTPPFINSVESKSPEAGRYALYSSNPNVIDITVNAAKTNNRLRSTYLQEGTAVLTSEVLPFKINVIVGDGTGDKKDIKDAKVELPLTSFGYTSGEIIPYASLTYEDTLLEENTDYTVTCTNNIDIGTVKLIFTGKGEYAGSTETEFSIIPETVAIKSIQKLKSKYTIAWNENPEASGYEIRYSKKKSSGYKKLTATAKLTVTSDKLKSGMYIKIRTYKTVDGQKIYSEYSKPIKIK